MSILKVRNKTTNQWEEIQAIKGDTGEQGIQGDKGDKGDTGASGADAKINGVNTLTVEAGDNITLEQEGNTLTINSTGGGTTDYSNLSNKPKINSVELNGNKSLSDLGVQETLVSGTNIKTINNNSILGSGNITIQGGGGTSDYSDLTNKPQINSVTLSGNKTTSDLGLGTITSVKMNGSTVATSGEADLGTVITSHQDISGKQDITDNTLQTTNKTVPTAINEVNSIAKGANQAVGYSNYQAMITAINAMDDEEFSMGQNIYIVTVNVPDLWVSSVESTSSTYTYVDDATFVSALETNGYVQVGYYKLSMLETQKVDLTNYVTNTDYASNSTGGVVKTNTNYGTSVDSNGSLRGTTKTYADYDSMHNLGLISKVTLENVITGKGLVSNTDYGSFATAGVVKASSTYGTQFASTGAMYAQTKTYEQYTSSTSPGLFIGKGTLENVIEGKGLVNNTDYASSSVGGVIKTGASYGTTMASSGTLRAIVKTYEDYSSAGSYMFVSKGTLENVITGKGLIDNTYHDSSKQDTLVSGTNIKTINNTSILGSGDLSIQEGETLPVGSEIDYDGQTVPTGWEQVDEVPVYSTTETVCGTWIDDSPIYRKVINFTNTSTDWVSIDTISNLNEIVRMNGYVYDRDNNKTVIPSYGTDSVSLYVTQGGAIRKKATSYYQNKSGVLIIEYTKTTN